MNTPPTDQPSCSARHIDAGHCPVCGQPNLCAMEQARLTGQSECGPCWCTQATFGADLLARVPEQVRGKSCICARCASQQ